jgi:hypothetical protein
VPTGTIRRIRTRGEAPSLEDPRGVPAHFLHLPAGFRARELQRACGNVAEGDHALHCTRRSRKNRTQSEHIANSIFLTQVMGRKTTQTA